MSLFTNAEIKCTQIGPWEYDEFKWKFDYMNDDRLENIFIAFS